MLPRFLMAHFGASFCLVLFAMSFPSASSLARADTPETVTLTIENPLEETVRLRLWCNLHGEWAPLGGDEGRFGWITIPRESSRKRALPHAGEYRVYIVNRSNVYKDWEDITFKDSGMFIIKKAMLSVYQPTNGSCQRRRFRTKEPRPAHYYLEEKSPEVR